MIFTRARTPVAGVLVIGSALLASGCTKTLDQGSVQSAIKKNFPTIKSISCPSGVNAKTGTTFTCTATNVDGSTTQYTAVETDNNGHFNVAPVGAGAAPGGTDTSGSGTDTSGAGTTSGSGTDTSGSGTDTSGSSTDTSGGTTT